MLVGVGVDLVEVARVRAELARDGDGFKQSLFTEGEVADCDARRYAARHYAARFAAKEAVLKALGAGAPHAGVFRDVEILSDDAGKPRVVLHGATRSAAEGLGADRILVSLSHTSDWAVASAIVATGAGGSAA